MEKLKINVVLFFLLMNPGCREHNELINQQTNKNPAQRFSALTSKLKVITSMSDQKRMSQSILYGNQVAFVNATAGAKQMTGGLLMLVTWKSVPDAMWFGGKVPGDMLSVELLKSAHEKGGTDGYEYSLYAGKSLSNAEDLDENFISARKKFMLTSKAAVMP